MVLREVTPNRSTYLLVKGGAIPHHPSGSAVTVPVLISSGIRAAGIRVQQIQFITSSVSHLGCNTARSETGECEGAFAGVCVSGSVQAERCVSDVCACVLRVFVCVCGGGCV